MQPAEMRKKKKCGKCGEDINISKLKKDIIRLHERESDDLKERVRALEQDKRVEVVADGRHKVTCEYDAGEDTLSIDIEKAQGLLRKEQSRRKQLLKRIEALEDEMRRKEHLLRCHEKKEDCLQKKATIDIVLDDERPQGRAERIMRLARQVQRQLEDGPCSVELDRLESEVEKLVCYADSQPGIVLDIEDEHKECWRDRPVKSTVHLDTRCGRASGCSSVIRASFSPCSSGGGSVCSRPCTPPCSRPCSRPCSPRGRSLSPVAVQISRSPSPVCSGTRKHWEVRLPKTKDDLRLENALESIQCNLDYLIEQEKLKRWQEAQIRHLGYYPRERLPKTALYNPPHLI